MIVTLAEAKAYLGEASSTYDTFLTGQLNLIQEAVETYCRRKFEKFNYVQTFYKEDYKRAQKTLNLFHFPVATVTSVEVDDEATTDYRINKPTAILMRNNEYFFIGEDKVEVAYSAGYDHADIPYIITNVILSLIEERYNKKKSGVALNFGSDVQRLSIPGTISIDFDYSLTTNDRTNTFGNILGSQINNLDYFRSERIAAAGTITYVEKV